MACRTGCRTKDHATYGECCRASNVKSMMMDYAKGFDYTREKRWNAELGEYRQALAEGIEPAGTTMSAINEARKISDATGKAFDGANPIASLPIQE